MKHTEKVENQGEIQDMPFFHQKHACNRRNQGEIRVVLNSSPATSIKHQRVSEETLCLKVLKTVKVTLIVQIKAINKQREHSLYSLVLQL